MVILVKISQTEIAMESCSNGHIRVIIWIFWIFFYRAHGYDKEHL